MVNEDQKGNSLRSEKLTGMKLHLGKSTRIIETSYFLKNMFYYINF